MGADIGDPKAMRALSACYRENRDALGDIMDAQTAEQNATELDLRAERIELELQMQSQENMTFS
jgi:Sec-independent protein translocase protein TatA